MVRKLILLPAVGGRSENKFFYPYNQTKLVNVTVTKVFAYSWSLNGTV